MLCSQDELFLLPDTSEILASPSQHRREWEEEVLTPLSSLGNRFIFNVYLLSYGWARAMQSCIEANIANQTLKTRLRFSRRLPSQYQRDWEEEVPTPYTLHPAPYTLHPTLLTLHSTPYTIHSTPNTLKPTPYTLHPALYTQHTTLHTLHPALYTLHLTPYT